MKELTLGIISSMFFAVTFILNHSMELTGGSWMWSSSLRFLFMLPFLFLIVGFRKNINQVWIEMKKKPFEWLTWSFVGFVLFYGPLTYAAAYGPGWLVAGTWQFTIVAGILLAPLFYTAEPARRRHTIQKKALAISSIILVGVLFIQVQNAGDSSFSEVLMGVVPVIVAAFAYPLGNRKMMEVCGGRLDTFQRILGMTIATTPFWLILGCFALFKTGTPSSSQVAQTFIVAICSGVIATSLFFLATNMARNHPGKLAAVEATQSTQILFVIMGEASILSVPFPAGSALIGILLIITGMIFHTINVKRMNAGSMKPIKSAS
ncbi:multidrug resistance efflux transporter family protein [Rossellomorea aquimaris]|uniref:DMT family transporter n=1 Tax=Rossellomorea aquimaris TaxID=189382 RepID=UPI001CD38C39|nr:multidrug resistance efflux transporter family protein [Rossellomorea aquimaris]MCA1060543.1 multidrug resistance efflux transporter family protein [Rossellomorea aquimaris]